MPSQAAINALNLIDDAPNDELIERLLVKENKRLRAQVSMLRYLKTEVVELRNQLAESLAHIDTLQSQLAMRERVIDTLQTQLAEVTQ